MTHWKLNAGLALGLFGFIALALFAGDTRLEVDHFLGALSGDESLGPLVMRELRIPRVLLGVLVGAGLGASGAVLQGFFRNPLVTSFHCYHGVIGDCRTVRFSRTHHVSLLHDRGIFVV